MLSAALNVVLLCAEVTEGGGQGIYLFKENEKAERRGSENGF